MELAARNVEDLVAEGLVGVSENGVTTKIPASFRLLYIHKKAAGITFSKMSKGKKDQAFDDISCLCWSLTRAALSGSVHCFSQDRSFFVSILCFGCAKASSVCSGVPSGEA